MITVFLGPSLPLAEARAMLDADFRPPAAMGDVLRAAVGGAKAIAIIDGIFERAPAVWHKEILFALSRGIPVYGSSSMGALRAAECHTFGMRGVGRVFEAFRDGVLEDDDEVAVAHAGAEHGFRCLSDAMVNIREAVRGATAQRMLSAASAARLLDEAKSRFYPDRSWRDIVRCAAWMPEEESRRLRADMPEAPDVKRADARLLLTELRRLAGEGLPKAEPGFDFEPTSYWQSTMLRECPVTQSGAPGAEAVHRWKLTGHLRLIRKDRRDLVREALADFLVTSAASHLGIRPNGVHDAYAVSAVEPLLAQIESDAEALARRLGPQLAPYLTVALARRRELAPELERASEKWRHVASRGVEWPQPSDAGTDLLELSDWYEANFASLEAGGAAHAAALGFESWEEFMGELVAEFMLRAKQS